MESVFCFEIAVGTLKLRKKVQCEHPFVTVSFLDFPTIVIRLDQAYHEKNEYAFDKGKSCLFKMSPTELYQQLTASPIYIVIFDQSLTVDNEEDRPLIGSSTFSLDKTIKDVIRDVQLYGLNRTTCHGHSTSATVVNFLQNTIGCIDIIYKLTCLGHTVLPHLSTVPPYQKTSKSIKPADLLIKKPAPLQTLSSIENNVFPPVLYYTAPSSQKTKDKGTGEKNKTTDDSNRESKKTQQPSGDDLQHAQTLSNLTQMSKEKNHVARENTIKDWRDQSLIKITTSLSQKCESTQTDMKDLDQFPILRGLIEEVLELGLNRPSSAPSNQQKQFDVANAIDAASRARAQTAVMIKSKGPVMKIADTTYQVKKMELKKDPPKKKYPLHYGLTKTHMLRLSKNRQLESSVVLSTTFEKPKTKKSTQFRKRKVKSSQKLRPDLASTYTQTAAINIVDPLQSITEDITSENGSVELNIPDLSTEVRSTIMTQDKGTPRALSRQSIEIRLPTAETENVDGDLPDQYKYSDDFDEERSWSYERTASALTTLDSSPQYTTFDTKESPERDSPHRLTVDVSPQATISDLSPSMSFGITPRDSIPEEPELEDVKPTLPDVVEESLSEKGKVEDEPLLKLSPIHDSQYDTDSKPTDDSASIVTTLMTTKLPIPAPSSDSPIIRSLVSEPGSRKPRPPSVSHSSSMERIHRKFKRSTESSFHISDISDVRTSELADIRTSELSDLKSSDENISPLNSTDVIGVKTSLPKLKKKYHFL